MADVTDYTAPRGTTPNKNALVRDLGVEDAAVISKRRVHTHFSTGYHW